MWLMVAWDFVSGAFRAVAGFFSKRPVLIVYAAIAGAVLAGWLHYRDLRSDLAEVRAEAQATELLLEQQRSATDAAVTRAEELAEDFRGFQATIDELKVRDDEISEDTRRIRQRVEGLRLDRAIEADPALAGDVATREYGAARRMLDCATGADCAAAGEGAAGTP